MSSEIKECKAPVLTIQCDWYSILSDVGAEAWISCKYKDQPSIHGKIRTVTSLPRPPSVAISEGFMVDNVSMNAITISLKDLSHSTIFVAPKRSYPNIHQGASVQSLDVNENGLAVSASAKDSLVVWDTQSEEVKLILSGHVGEVYRCRFFPSGKVVLSCGSDMTLKIWCAITGQCPVTLKGHTMAVTGLDFVGRGKNVISCSKDGKVNLWKCGDASCVATLASVPSSINCCHISTAAASLHLEPVHPHQPPNDGEWETGDKVVLYGCEDGTVGCIAVHSRQLLFSQRHPAPVNCLAWLSPHLFLVGRHDGQLLLYTPESSNRPRTVWLESNSPVLALLPYRDVGFFVSRADGTVSFLSSDPRATKRISLTGSDCDPVYDIATDGKNIFTCCRDGVIRQYSVENFIKSLF